MDRIEIITVFLCFLILIETLVTLGIYIEQNNKIVELQNKIDSVEYELKESEKKCERMTDTCIDILSNKRWE